MKKIIYLSSFIMIGILVCACTSSKESWAVRMADSDITRFPEGWQLDHGSRKIFGYSQGVECLAILKLWSKTKDPKYYDYVHSYYDSMIDDNGTILNYRRTHYNVDMVNAGKNLYILYKETKNEKYKKALDTLRLQMKEQPRTNTGGFWHKQIYPYQMWLDGIYMYGPFLAQYAATFNEPDLFDEVVKQITLIAEHTKDETTGLYAHAWDESRQQRWCDPETGKSHNFWGRGMGWYMMAMVDVLDFLPETHQGRAKVIAIFSGLAESLSRYQDDETGLWYQVVDQGTREGNYLEASISSMMAYSLAKGVNKGYLDTKYKAIAEKAFRGLTTVLIRENEDGTISLTQCCAVGGLGGNPYRDGSYEYYINEKIRENDAKATGPFIMAALELNQ